jgi:CelD/BcsL family acetyltransferase involved in cellulose biosynthesis
MEELAARGTAAAAAGQEMRGSEAARSPVGVWWRALEEDALALPFQTPTWLRCVAELTDYRAAPRIYRADDGSDLVLPLARRRYLAGQVANSASFPFGWGNGGLVGARASDDSAIQMALRELMARPELAVTLKPNPVVGRRWSALAPPNALRIPRRAHVLRLDADFDAMFARFSRSARYQVRRARRDGVEVKSASGADLVPAFDRLYRRSIDRWAAREHEPRRLAQLRGRRRDPAAKFDLVARRFGPRCRVWVAQVRGQAAAAIIVLRQGRTACYWRGAMDERLARNSHASLLLHAAAIEDACASGVDWYQMGDTGTAPGLSQFKESVGARPYDYDELRFERLPFTRTSARARGLAKRVLRVRS